MSFKATTDHGLSRRALFGAGLGRLARSRLEQLEALTGENGSASAAADRGLGTGQLEQELRRAFGADGPQPFLRQLEPVAERLVAAARVEGGQLALDVGAGDGNVAVALARRGAVTEACDLAPAMVERGRARTDAERLAVDWHQADVEALPSGDGVFDLVLSSFGAIWAPRADRAVAELTRVCRPGGTIGLAAPVPRGFLGRAIALGREAAGWPAKVQQPERWGRYETAYLHLFGLEHLEVVDETVQLDFEDADELWDALSSPAGPLGRARLAKPDKADDLRDQILRLAAEHGEMSERAVIPCPYALLIGQRPSEALPDRSRLERSTRSSAASAFVCRPRLRPLAAVPAPP